MESLTGFYLSRYGLLHKMVLVFWLNLPYMGVLLLTYPYSEFFWYPCWFLNLQTAWLVFCCFDYGLTQLVDKVLWVEFLFVLTTAFFCGYTDIVDDKASKERMQYIEQMLDNEKTLQTRGFVLFIGFSEDEARMYFKILAKFIQKTETYDRDRRNKWRGLAMLYSLPMSLLPMLRRRVLFCVVMSCVALIAWIVWFLYNWNAVSTHKSELHAMLQKKHEKDKKWF
jgi:hypothetical protein